MKPWSEFYDLTVPDLPGCPMGVLNYALRQSAIAFCEQSQAWKFTLDDIAVEANTGVYALINTPVGSIVHVITYAKFNDTEISPNTSESNIPIWNWRDQTGIPEYVLGGPTAVTLVPTPNLNGTLKLIAVLKPTPVAEGIDDDIFNEYREAIVHGAKSRLMLSPKKPYTDASLGTYHNQQFAIKTASAGNRADRNYTREPLRTSIMRRG